MNWLTAWVLAAALGLGFYAASSRPSRHTFDPSELHPSECRICGRRRDKHPT